MRIINRLWIFFWANYIFPDSVSAVTISCPPAKEYKPYTLNCPTNNIEVEWKSTTSGASYAICNPVCRPTQPDITSATWNSTVSTFTILNMLRSGPFYLQGIACFQIVDGVGTNLVSSCKLESVYVRPEKPTCENPSLSDTSVSLTCQTQKIFPTAGCVFYNKTTALHGTVTYNNGTLVNQTTDYYRPQCTITLSLGSDIGPGVHQFKVLMYPDVPGGINFGSESDLTSVVNLVLPSASLSTSCSSGVNVTENYIKEGSTVMCQCSLDKDGNPPGWVEWFDSSNQPVSGIRDKTAVLTVNVDPNGPSPDFICRGVSALGHEVSGVSFKKEIAFGPVLVNILDDKGYNHYDLCPSNPSIQLTVYCEVPVTSVNPEPTIIVSINSLSPSKETSVTNTTHYRMKSVFTLTTSGRHEVTCLAKNSVFPTIRKQDTLAVTISAKSVNNERTKETAIVGGVLGGLLIIMFGVVIFLVLRRKEKMLCCYKKDTDHGQKFSDPKTTQDCPDAQVYMDQHQNEASDGYEVPVTPHLTSHYENSLAPGNADKGIPTVDTKPEKRENVEYENTF